MDMIWHNDKLVKLYIREMSWNFKPAIFNNLPKSLKSSFDPTYLSLFSKEMTLYFLLQIVMK